MVLTAAVPLSAQAENAGPSLRAVTAPKAVVELFTSQGCSSCPPADKLLGQISQRPDVIALTLAVDYWDYLGWKDTLARHGHSMRQKAYARARGDGKMFTPQAVVNGRLMAVGSDSAALEKALDSAVRPTVPVAMRVQNGRVSVKVSSALGAGEVWLCPLVSNVTVNIGRGENEGATMNYHNVVRRWVKLGDWTGTEATFDTDIESLRTDGVDSFAVLVQAGSPSAPGAILGAAMQPLH